MLSNHKFCLARPRAANFVKSPVIADSLFKKWKGLSEDREMNYNRTVTVGSVNIPIGKIANCFRYLARHHNGMGKALVSPSAQNFITTGICFYPPTVEERTGP